MQAADYVAARSLSGRLRGSRAIILQFVMVYVSRKNWSEDCSGKTA
jgi:hypothetical protein